MKLLRIAAHGRIALVCLLLATLSGLAQQQGTSTVKLEVTMIDSATGEVLPFGNLVVFNAFGEVVASCETNLDEGKVVFYRLASAEYTVKGYYPGYHANEQRVDLRSSERFVSIEQKLTARPALVPDEMESEFMGTRSDSSHVAMDTTVSGEEELTVGELWMLNADLNDFVCYPNPARDYLHVIIDGVKATELVMLSPLGQVQQTFDLSKEWDIVIDLRPYPPGVYYIICSGKGRSSEARKVVKGG